MWEAAMSRRSLPSNVGCRGERGGREGEREGGKKERRGKERGRETVIQMQLAIGYNNIIITT
jgi:hypothetical protein